MNINNSQGDLPDVSARKEPLVGRIANVSPRASFFKTKLFYFFGYFDPENIFLDNENKCFLGWHNPHFGYKSSTGDLTCKSRSCSRSCATTTTLPGPKVSPIIALCSLTLKKTTRRTPDSAARKSGRLGSVPKRVESIDSSSNAFAWQALQGQVVFSATFSKIKWNIFWILWSRKCFF